MFQVSKLDSAAFIAFIVFVVLLLRSRSRRYSSSLPPGPNPLPLVGNVLDLPAKEQWLAVTEMAQTFGNVCHLNVMGQSIMFLNTYEAAVDLLEKRGSIYSDRMQYVMANELCGLSHDTVLLGFCDKFRRQRRLIDRALGAPSVRALYQPLIATQTQLFLHRLLDSEDPSDYRHHIRRYAGSLILSTIYGYRVQSEDDKFLTLVASGMSIITDEIFSGSGLWLVDIFPSLNHIPSWFPGAGFKRKAAVWKKELERLINEPYDHVKMMMRDGSAAPSFCSTLIGDDGPINTEKEDDIRSSATAMFSASTETTISLMDQFILAMVLHPDVQAKAQAEIDAVVGNDRWPTFSDRPSLPYIDAIMSECMRWGVPVPLNVPHRLMEDDVYCGMHLPAGSLIIANIWRMCRNEELYPNAETFDPERFMTKGDEQTGRRKDPRNFVFGFGRRRCAGVHLVECSVWLLMVSMLATLKLSKATDENGKVIEPDIRYGPGFFRMANVFKCEIKPRSERALKLIHESVL